MNRIVILITLLVTAVFASNANAGVMLSSGVNSSTQAVEEVDQPESAIEIPNGESGATANPVLNFTVLVLGAILPRAESIADCDHSGRVLITDSRAPAKPELDGLLKPPREGLAGLY